MAADAQNRLPLPLLLSFPAGYVDTAGFLALHRLFTAHVTGNFVTLGASLALGTSGAIAKLLALPLFCAVEVFEGPGAWRRLLLKAHGRVLETKTARTFPTRQHPSRRWPV
jgi:uncharacterized membrane protein YoaK (UPF0700 family)